MNEHELKESGLTMPPVCIFDATYVLKYSNDRFRTGYEFVMAQIVGEIDPSFAAGAQIVYFCLDRGSPVNKSPEHQDRYKNVKTREVPKNKRDLESLVVTLEHMDDAEGRRRKRITEMANNQLKRSKDDIIYQQPIALAEMEKNGILLVMADDRIPKKEVWSEVMGNSYMKKQVLHYVTQALIMDARFEEILYRSGVMLRLGSDPKGNLGGYVPSNGGILCLHGGCSNRPQPDGSMICHHYDEKSNALEWEEVPFKPDDKLITITSVVANHAKRNAQGNFSTRTRVVSAIEEQYPPEVVENLLEGEIAGTYYSQKHDVDGQLFTTVDGDVIIISLLASRRRLVPGIPSKFKNKLHLRLKIGGTKVVQVTDLETGRVSNKTISKDDYLDVNMLYQSILKLKPFKSLRDPMCCFAMVSALMGNDYIRGYGTGFNGTDRGGVPWLLYPLLHNAEAYRDLIITGIEESDSKDSDKALSYFVILDEKLFYRYTKECYFHASKGLAKIQKLIPSNLVYANGKDRNDERRDQGSKTSVEAFYETVLKSEKRLDLMVEIIDKAKPSADKKLMTELTAVAYARRLKWLLLYWLNGYVGSCRFPDPCERMEGKSYYGWEWMKTRDGDKKLCVATDFVYHPTLNPNDEREKRSVAQQPPPRVVIPERRGKKRIGDDVDTTGGSRTKKQKIPPARGKRNRDDGNVEAPPPKKRKFEPVVKSPNDDGFVPRQTKSNEFDIFGDFDSNVLKSQPPDAKKKKNSGEGAFGVFDLKKFLYERESNVGSKQKEDQQNRQAQRLHQRHALNARVERQRRDERGFDSGW